MSGSKKRVAMSSDYPPVLERLGVTAARELAACAAEQGLHEERIIPRMDEWIIYPRVAIATALAAQQHG